MNVIRYENEDLEFVETYTKDKSHHRADFWSDESVSEIKERVKRFYIKAQDYRCCYCKHRNMTDNLSSWTLDHVLPRDSFPQFMFHPENLAVSCHDCNIAKSAKVLLDRRTRIRFPNSSKPYTLCHPHYDSWDEHIERYGTTAYNSLSKKGAVTITECNLFRFAEKITGSRNAMADRRFENYFDDLARGTRDEKLLALDVLRTLILNS